jgi:hypothetical protein
MSASTPSDDSTLEYADHAGAYGIRFCYYNHEGRFQRSPMMIDGQDSLDGLRAALKRYAAPARAAAKTRHLKMVVYSWAMARSNRAKRLLQPLPGGCRS